MSDARVGALALGLCLTLVGAAGVAAQAGTAAELRDAATRVRQLQRQRDSLDALIRARDAQRDRALGWKQVQVGRLRVELLPDEVAGLEPGVRRAWELVRQRFGRLADDGTLVHLRLQRDPGRGARPTTSVSIFRLDRARSGQPYTTHRVVGSAEVDSLAFGIAVSAMEALNATHDSLLTPWVGVSVPLVEPPRLRGRVYVHLVTSPYQLARSCQIGDLRACARALGIEQPVDFSGWFEPAERRRLAGTEPWGQLYRSCEKAGYIPACDSVLAADPSRVLLPLGDADSRASLLLTLLELGGSEALARVDAARGAPLPDRLAAGAGVPLDSLLRRWHASILAARPLPVTVRSRDAATAMFWFVVLLALALGSTRWR